MKGLEILAHVNHMIKSMRMGEALASHSMEEKTEATWLAQAHIAGKRERRIQTQGCASQEAGIPDLTLLCHITFQSIIV